jgi:hypothetical protein
LSELTIKKRKTPYNNFLEKDRERKLSTRSAR